MSLSRISKRFARKVIRGVRIPIQGGVNSGLSWSVPTRMNFLTGRYERALSNFLASLIHRDEIFWDIGAHFGYYSLLAARRIVGGCVYSFEPSTENLWFLNHHRAWNNLSNIIIHPIALSAVVGESQFGGTGTGDGRLGVGRYKVPMTTIDHLIETGQCRVPTLLKMDVQGAEADVLRGGRETFLANDILMLIATHGDSIHHECVSILREYQYEITDFPKRKIILASLGIRQFNHEAFENIVRYLRSGQPNHF